MTDNNPTLPAWLWIDANNVMHIDGALALSEMGVPNNPENQALLTEEIKKWTRETAPGVPVMEEHEL